MFMLEKLLQEIEKLANPTKAKNHYRFFKTGKGEYGEGDKFYGLTVPEQRTLSKKYKNLSLEELQKLINSPWHEHRSLALMILTLQYPKADENGKKLICDFYLENAKRINNWDLVDISAPKIPGDYLFDKDKSILYKFAKSNNLWEKRISIMSTFGFLRRGKYEDTLAIAEILLHDKHDLIHKAVGWMLREIGKRDQAIEEKFLIKYYKIMPRTMLRYAIEKFEEKKRRWYLESSRYDKNSKNKILDSKKVQNLKSKIII